MVSGDSDDIEEWGRSEVKCERKQEEKEKKNISNLGADPECLLVQCAYIRRRPLLLWD